MKKTIKLFWDMEFTGLNQKTTPISLGIISELGQTFYAEFTDFDIEQVDVWIQKNVIDVLTLKKRTPENTFYGIDGDCSFVKGNRKIVLERLNEWLKQFDSVEFWGDCLAYDWVLFCELYKGALNLPKKIYYIPFDICTLMKLKGVDPDVNRETFSKGYYSKEKDDAKHNALTDAKIIKACFDKLQKYD